MKIKRRKRKEPKKFKSEPGKKLELDEQIKRIAIRKFKKAIKESDDSVIFQWGLELEKAPQDKKLEIEEKILNHQLSARAKIVKRLFRQLIGIPAVTDFLKKNYSRELNYSKYEIFPRKWMTDNKKISSILKRYPLINEFLNYLFNYNRRQTIKQRNKMIKMTDLITGDKRHNGHFYTTFITDGEFWEKAAKELGVTPGRLKLYFQAFVKVGIVKRLGRVATHKKGQPPFLCSDGYLVNHEDITRKVSFLKKDRKGLDALRDLPKYLYVFRRQFFTKGMLQP